MTGRAIMTISPDALGEILRLPHGQTVVAARMDPMESRGEVEILVEGENLPEHREGEVVHRFRLVCTVEEKSDDSGQGLRRRVSAYRADNRAEAWIIRDWEPIP